MLPINPQVDLLRPLRGDDWRYFGACVAVFGASHTSDSFRNEQVLPHSERQSQKGRVN